MTQLDRVLRAAKSFRGVNAVDFLGPDVIDNGPPITRLAARINDARERGYEFEILRDRQKCRVYRLTEDSAARFEAEGSAGTVGEATQTRTATLEPDGRGSASSAPLSPEPEPLFEVEPTRPHWREEAA